MIGVWKFMLSVLGKSICSSIEPAALTLRARKKTQARQTSWKVINQRTTGQRMSFASRRPSTRRSPRRRLSMACPGRVR